jgi:hypothetical protein
LLLFNCVFEHVLAGAVAGIFQQEQAEGTEKKHR